MKCDRLLRAHQEEVGADASDDGAVAGARIDRPGALPIDGVGVEDVNAVILGRDLGAPLGDLGRGKQVLGGRQPLPLRGVDLEIDLLHARGGGCVNAFRLDGEGRV